MPHVLHALLHALLHVLLHELLNALFAASCSTVRFATRHSDLEGAASTCINVEE